MNKKQQPRKERGREWLSSSSHRHSEPETDQLSVANESTASSCCDDRKDWTNGPSVVTEIVLRILLVGLSGSGKSATGNTILGVKRFKDDIGPESVTTECQLEDAINAGRKVQVLDTPGFFDTKLSDEETATCILESGTLLRPGPHVILFTINIASRFDEKITHAFERLKQYLGSDVVEYVVIAFTHVDQLGKKKSTVDYINGLTALKSIVGECGDRYVTFNNQTVDKEQMISFFKFADERLGKRYFVVGRQNREEMLKKLEEADKREVSKRPYGARLEKAVAAENKARERAEIELKREEEKTKEKDKELKRVQQEKEEVERQLEEDNNQREEEIKKQNEKLNRIKTKIINRKYIHRAVEGTATTLGLGSAYFGGTSGQVAGYLCGAVVAASQITDLAITPGDLDECKASTKQHVDKKKQ